MENEPRCVLLVDDESDIRAIGQIALEDVGGWRTLLAATGSDALALATRELPDVIVMDVMMPGMDGPKTLEGLRASAATRHIPVIFMTAKAQNAEIQGYLDLGAAGVIKKPFDPMTLPDAIRGILDTSR